MGSNKPRTLEEYLSLEQTRNIRLIGNMPKSILLKTRWHCTTCNYEWEATFANITHPSRPTGCPKCAGKADLTEQDYHNAAKKLNFTWIGKEKPKQSGYKTQWMCSEGHLIELAYETIVNNIKKGFVSCSKCSGKAKLQSFEYDELANSLDLDWLGINPVPNETRTTWRCHYCNHIWDTSYTSLNHAKYGCPRCAAAQTGAVRRVQDEEYIRVAKEKDVDWFDITASNANYPATWRCHKNRHIFQSSYNAFRDSLGCPICGGYVNGRKTSTQQLKIAHMINGTINYIIGRYRVDVALVNHKIVIEYDSWFWHGHPHYDEESRLNSIVNDGWKLIIIKSNFKIPKLIELTSCIFSLQTSNLNRLTLHLPDWGIGKTYHLSKIT